MKLLFLHQNFPGQYRHLAPYLASDPANEVVAIADEKNDVPNRNSHGIRLINYKSPQPPTNDIHPYLPAFETAIRRGQRVARVCLGLRQEGFVPDVIIAHPGWGDALFVKDIYPESRLLNFCEFYYGAQGSDLNFDPEYPHSLDVALGARIANALFLLSLNSCDWAITPTHWQWTVQPVEYRSKISVIFDGINTSGVKPNAGIVISLGEGQPTLTSADEVITYVSQGLEPVRGWHTFMRAVPAIQNRHPNAHILIVGSDNPSYSRKPEGQSYREQYLNEVKDRIDMEQISFLGKVPYEQYLAILQVSSVHVYLTYPFVLSWSMLEAMSAGCLVVGSRTAPVEEVIEDNHNGLLVDFFSPAEIAAAVDKVLAHPDRMSEIRQRARQTVIERFDLTSVCLPQQINLIHRLAAGYLPPALANSPRFA